VRQANPPATQESHENPGRRDGSVYTKRMLAYMAAHDEWLGDRHEYTLLHGAARAPRPAPAGDAGQKPTTRHQEGLAAHLLPAHGLNARTSRLTKGRYDLLMMGSHGHGS
jgi:hypothetical protein